MHFCLLECEEEKPAGPGGATGVVSPNGGPVAASGLQRPRREDRSRPCHVDHPHVAPDICHLSGRYTKRTLITQCISLSL